MSSAGLCLYNGLDLVCRLFFQIGVMRVFHSFLYFKDLKNKSIIFFHFITLLQLILFLWIVSKATTSSWFSSLWSFRFLYDISLTTDYQMKRNAFGEKCFSMTFSRAQWEINEILTFHYSIVAKKATFLLTLFVSHL